MTEPDENPRPPAQPGDPGAQAEEARRAARPAREAEEPPTRTAQFFHDLFSGGWIVSLLAIVVALVLSGVLIVLADAKVQESAGYIFARPGDFFGAGWDAVYTAYRAMFRGAIYDFQAPTLTRAIRPITETLVFSIPLILGGLGLAVGFRAGLFNIGGQGQIILGAIFAGFIGFTFDLPIGLHLLLCIAGAILGGAMWGGIAGALKAKTGANEVIVTIMLNNIAIFLLAYLLKTQAFRVPGSTLPKSSAIADSAALPMFLGPPFRLHAGILLAILATVAVWWLLERSTLGFEIRAAGANPHAARTAGISVERVVFLTMVISGTLTGLAGGALILGTERALVSGLAGTYGFDAITVALLGRSRPLGTFFAGLLFGALKAGGFLMQATTAMPIDIILVVQSIIVLLIAAPPLVRAIFRLPSPGSRPRRVAPAAAKEAAA